MVVTANENHSTYNCMYPFIVTMHCMSVLSIKSEQMTLHMHILLMTVCFMIGMCKLKL